MFKTLSFTLINGNKKEHVNSTKSHYQKIGMFDLSNLTP